jgi:predicted negative regulator of RcsB-dependent stress response
MVMPKRPAWIAVAAMLLVGIVLGGWQWRQQQVRKEREQAEVVQRQFDMAMQVTQRTLAGVQNLVGKTVRDSVRQ